VDDYGISDNRIGYNLYYDTTLARKSAQTPQLIKWNAIRPGVQVIIRPTQLGGSYVIPMSSYTQPANTVPNVQPNLKLSGRRSY